ncbi:hypothetical protein [Azospirillum sp. TSO5]|uniref:hypothetical protein n=1 Tax=Azospirillum sp. TSO5 TaxID=716760 RepID=UPI000D605EAA|nr:hypothetical protein [Azospirillum sp. TSO5]PWC98008.1 hypothetical protein TSO5_03485 [Azospirillum sp. TSO5]
MDASAFVRPERRLVETTLFTGHQNEAMLRAARDALCGTALQRGYTLISCDDWDLLERINRENLDSWLPIMHRPNGDGWFWVGAADADGRIVATQAGVLIDCGQRSFGDRLSDLSFFYADPERDNGVGEMCFCASDTAFKTLGQFCYLTAGWTHPAARGKGLFHLVGRAVRLLAMGRWSPNWWGGMVAPGTVPQWAEKKAGRRFLEHRPTILYQNPPCGFEYPPLHFMRISRSAFFLDMQAVIDAARQS